MILEFHANLGLFGPNTATRTNSHGYRAARLVLKVASGHALNAVIQPAGLPPPRAIRRQYSVAPEATPQEGAGRGLLPTVRR